MTKTISEIFQDIKAKESAIKRMKKYTDKTSVTECWKWQSHCNDQGYAMLSIGGRKGLYARASRISWYLKFGSFDENLYVCHKCDNPSCVNPNHLFLGSAKDNTQDMIRKNRDSEPPQFYGEEVTNHKLMTEEVYDIYNSSLPIKELAEIYNVSKNTIYRIKKGESWPHLKLEPKTFELRVPNTKKISDKEVINIRNSTLSNKELANKYNVTTRTIRNIKSFRSRKDVK